MGWGSLSANYRWKGTWPTNQCWCLKTRGTALSCGIKISAVCSFILSQSVCVTDGRMDRQINGQTEGKKYNSQDGTSIVASHGKKIYKSSQTNQPITVLDATWQISNDYASELAYFHNKQVKLVCHHCTRAHSIHHSRPLLDIIRRYLQRIHTNLDELSFLTVFALPNASRIGFACSNCCSNSPYTHETTDIVFTLQHWAGVALHHIHA